MPLLKRWLLARLAALLLLGSAVAGCQSTPIYRGHLLTPGMEPPAEQPLVPVSASEPIPPAVTTSQAYATAPMPVLPPASLPSAGRSAAQPQACENCRPNPIPQHSRGLLTWFRRPTHQEPPRLVPLPAVSAQAAPCVGPGCQSAMMLRPVPTDGTFTPAQRVASPDSLSVSYVPATRPGDLPTVDTAVAAKAAPPHPEVLPAPRTEKSNGNAAKPNNRVPTPMPRQVKQNGLPDLPLPTVTNPPAAPREFGKRALSDYVIEPPDVLQIDLGPGVGDPKFPIRGTHLVRPDGTIGLGPHGSVFVAGLTLDQAKQRIAHVITTSLFEEKLYYEKFRQVMGGLKVDVAAYNSKFYYVIADGGGYGEQVYRVLCTGNETVLDAIAQVEGLPRVASKKRIWLARATPTGVAHPHVLPVDWIAITQLGAAGTNYQIYPGDRIYIESDPLIRADSFLAKVISPIERLFGITLLGATTVNAIKGQQLGGGIR